MLKNKPLKVNNLINHLKQCPAAFLRSSNIFTKGGVDTNALIADVFRKITDNYLTDFELTSRMQLFKSCDSNHLISIQICSWLLRYDGFRLVATPNILMNLQELLFRDLAMLSDYIQHPKWVEDEDRAEELVRLVLKCCNIIPEGESRYEAEDRFDSLSTIKRHGVLEKSKEAYERMIEIKRKMAAKRAREAASPYGRE